LTEGLRTTLAAYCAPKAIHVKLTDDARRTHVAAANLALSSTTRHEALAILAHARVEVKLVFFVALSILLDGLRLVNHE
jgi:hypothetical protein